MRAWKALAIGFSLTLFHGCAARGSNKSAAEPAPASQSLPVAIDVSNHNWQDVVVYVVYGSQRTRLLTVTAAGAASGVLPAHAVRANGQIRLLAHAIGNPAKFMSEPFAVKPGMTIDWTLETDLKRSSLALW